MTFVFEIVETDEFFYVHAPDLLNAWKIFLSEYPDESNVHIYVRIV